MKISKCSRKDKNFMEYLVVFGGIVGLVIIVALVASIATVSSVAAKVAASEGESEDV